MFGYPPPQSFTATMTTAEETKEARAERRKRDIERLREVVAAGAPQMDRLRQQAAKTKEVLAQQEANRPQREAERRRAKEAERQQRKDVAGLKTRAARSDVVLGLVVAWQIVLTVGLLYVALTGQPPEQTCPSFSPGHY